MVRTCRAVRKRGADVEKRSFFLAAAACACLLAVLLIGGGGAHRGGTTADEPGLLAEYHGEKVYQTDVDSYCSMNRFFAGEDAELPTEQEILTEILQNIVLLEEAQRLGYAATQDEIDAMVENAKQGYALSEGKALLEGYCEWAGMTMDEYFVNLEAQAPRVIARQKLLNAVGEEFCEENGLTFTKVNPPPELVQAREDYVADLFAKAQDAITYYNAAG